MLNLQAMKTQGIMLINKKQKKLKSGILNFDQIKMKYLQNNY